MDQELERGARGVLTDREFVWDGPSRLCDVPLSKCHNVMDLMVACVGPFTRKAEICHSVIYNFFFHYFFLFQTNLAVKYLNLMKFITFKTQFPLLL